MSEEEIDIMIENALRPYILRIEKLEEIINVITGDY
jgi:uncharacterized protein (UPF0335 family)